MLFPFLYGLIACIASVTGSLIVLKWSTNERFIKRLVALSGGMLLSSAFLRIVPEAIRLDFQFGAISLLLFFLFFYVLEDFMMIHSCPEHASHCESHIIGALAFIGLSIHSLVDGIAVGSSFRFSPVLGITASFAVIFHKLGDGLSLSSILVSAKVEKRRVILMSLTIALFTLIGALFSFILTGAKPSTPLLASLLGISGASFIYISTSDLLPELHREKDYSLLLFILLGVFFIGLLTAIFRVE
ncbi:ZIP family metal transporter [bacterium]|nr:ZIP family metal transporter [bacterium]